MPTLCIGCNDGFYFLYIYSSPLSAPHWHALHIHAFHRQWLNLWQEEQGLALSTSPWMYPFTTHLSELEGFLEFSKEQLVLMILGCNEDFRHMKGDIFQLILPCTLFKERNSVHSLPASLQPSMEQHNTKWLPHHVMCVKSNLMQKHPSVFLSWHQCVTMYIL